MINLNKKIIFIANPKSGSDSIRHFLRSLGFISERQFLDDNKFKKICDKYVKDLEIKKWTTREDQKEHLSCFLYKKYLSENTNLRWEEFSVFSTIRNPWTRVVSAFHYAKKKGMIPNQSFADYVMNPTFIHTRSFDFMFKEENNLLCTKFLKTENLNNEIIDHLKLLGFNDLEFPNKTNVGNYKKNYKSYYNEHLKNLVYESNREVIELFDYSFEELS